MLRASKRNFARRNKTASGPPRQTETSFKIEDLRPNKTTGKLSYDQQPEFRSLSEFYIIIILKKLKIVERVWLRLWGFSEIHGPLLVLRAPGRCTG
jgi:hypothetical protein